MTNQLCKNCGHIKISHSVTYGCLQLVYDNFCSCMKFEEVKVNPVYTGGCGVCGKQFAECFCARNVAFGVEKFKVECAKCKSNKVLCDCFKLKEVKVEKRYRVKCDYRHYRLSEMYDLKSELTLEEIMRMFEPVEEKKECGHTIKCDNCGTVISLKNYIKQTFDQLRKEEEGRG